MHNIWQIARRELGAIFVQPLAYIFGVIIIALTGYIFASELRFLASQAGSLPVSVQSVISCRVG